MSGASKKKDSVASNGFRAGFGVDLGGDYFQRRDPMRMTKRLVGQLEALGHSVTLEEAVAA